MCVQELVSEKLKTQQRDNDLERMTHELEMKILNQESIQQAEQDAPDNRCIHTTWKWSNLDGTLEIIIIIITIIIMKLR